MPNTYIQLQHLCPPAYSFAASHNPAQKTPPHNPMSAFAMFSLLLRLFLLRNCCWMKIAKTHSEKSPGWFNSLAGVVKRRFASYVKLHLANGGSKSGSGAAPTNNSSTSTATANKSGDSGATTATAMANARSDRAEPRLNHFRSASASTAAAPTGSSTIGAYQNLYHHHQQQQQPNPYHYQPHVAMDHDALMYAKCAKPANNASPNALQHHQLNHQRHRSPDPPPRYNRGQSPLVLRRNLQELGAGGSPLLNRR